MMGTFLIYMIKLACFLIVFYLGFKVLLSGETFSAFNRKVLLTGIGISLLLPGMRINLPSDTPIQQSIQYIERVLQQPQQISTLTATPGYVPEVTRTFSWPACLTILYFAGVACHILILILSLLQVRSIIRTGIHRPEKQFTLVTSARPVTPFSWGRYVVVAASESPDDLPAILAHELAHRELNHRVDLIFLELLTAIQWFNPAVWLLKREMKEIHEFQADAVTITTGIQPQQYQLLLIKKAAGASSYTFASSLTHSKIKNRITMMFKEKSNPVKRSRILLLLPVAVALIYAFSGTGKQVSSTSEDNTNSKQIVHPFKVHHRVAANNPDNFIYLRFVHTDQQESEIRIAPDATQEVIREQIAQILSSEPTLEALFIEANQQVPMGYITDIKSLVRDHIDFVALSY